MENSNAILRWTVKCLLVSDVEEGKVEDDFNFLNCFQVVSPVTNRLRRGHLIDSIIRSADACKRCL